jgi:hypothetical protein
MIRYLIFFERLASSKSLSITVSAEPVNPLFSTGYSVISTAVQFSQFRLLINAPAAGRETRETAVKHVKRAENRAA